MRDVRTLVIGLLLGACVVLAAGEVPRPAQGQGRPVAAQRGRYHVTPTYAGANYHFFVHDLESDTIHHRVFAAHEMPGSGLTVEQILQKN
jgi:hypothetical protein